MTKTDILELFNSNNQEAQNAIILSYVQDKGNSLGDRWEVYTKAIRTNYLVNNDSWYFIPESLGDITLYDDYYIEKYQTYDYSTFTDDFEGNADELIVLKEEILTDGHSSWKYDW